MKNDKVFKLPDDAWEKAEKRVRDFLKNATAAGNDTPSCGNTPDNEPANVTKTFATIATQLWKAKSKMLDDATGEAFEESKSIYRHVEVSLRNLEDLGIEIKDHTDEPFDYGLPLKVVTTQPTPGLLKETVVETLRPTIYWKKSIIQMGEVVIATPMPNQPTP